MLSYTGMVNEEATKYTYNVCMRNTLWKVLREGEKKGV